jgi:hypothetical protein
VPGETCGIEQIRQKNDVNRPDRDEQELQQRQIRRCAAWNGASADADTGGRGSRGCENYHACDGSDCRRCRKFVLHVDIAAILRRLASFVMLATVSCSKNIYQLNHIVK